MILIDEVWILLIILGFVVDCIDMYMVIDKIILDIGDEYFMLDEKICVVFFMDDGNDWFEVKLFEVEILLEG